MWIQIPSFFLLLFSSFFLSFLLVHRLIIYSSVLCDEPFRFPIDILINVSENFNFNFFSTVFRTLLDRNSKEGSTMFKRVSYIKLNENWIDNDLFSVYITSFSFKNDFYWDYRLNFRDSYKSSICWGTVFLNCSWELSRNF